jgi:predicted CXXCH cytochrome family protein
MLRAALSTLGIGAGLLAIGLGGLALVQAPAVPGSQAEALRAGALYVGSARCRSCHGAHYASWYASYHRRMTAPADAANLLGAFDGRQLDYGGVRAHLERDAAGGPQLRVEVPGQAARVDRIGRTVGSHRYQQYLAERAGEWQRLPVAWDVAGQRFVHMNGAFLSPDPTPPAPGAPIALADYERHVTRWNDNCIYCHNTAPSPGLDPSSGRFDSQVAELGIACEACHGPGSEHARRNRNPLHRYALHLGGDADPSVANPARLGSARASQVCGRCHGQRLSPDIARVHQLGDRYVPGEDLRRYSTPLQHDTRLNGQPGVFAERFWADGTPRLTAYEYQGLLQSPCHVAGELQCESCHAMHGADPDLQPRAGRSGADACVGCHDELAASNARARHSRHLVGSSGARCTACHMPRLVYGLVGIRISHRIEVPDPARQQADVRPDACTLCHLDRSQPWAAEQTARLWGDGTVVGGAGGDGSVATPTADPGPLQAWAGSRLFGGDPIERATAAAALGALDAPAGLSFEVRAGLLLEAMAGDPYPALRTIAWRSLQALARTTRPEGGLSDAAFEPAELSALERGRKVAALRAALPGAVQPDPAALAALRERASQHAIFIGE